MRPLARRVALVTGASSGIGRAIALALAADGAALCLVGRDREWLAECARGGDIVFVNSTQGSVASPEVSQYAATKRGLKALADSLRAEVNAAGVRVLTLHLGRTASAMQERIFAEEGRPYRPEKLMQPEDVAAMVMAVLRLPRRAEVMSLSMRPAEKSY